MEFKINHINTGLNTKKTPDRQKKRLRKACDEFSAYFAKQMLSSMRKTVQKNDLLNGGNSEEIFKDMLDMEYAKDMTKSKQLKLSEILFKRLSKNI